MAENYSLNIDSIQKQLNLFSLEYSEDCFSFSIRDKGKPLSKVITIVDKQKNINGFLNCYIKKGQVSFLIQGKAEMKAICENCKKYIIETTRIENTLYKNFTLKNIDEDLFILFFDEFTQKYSTKETQKDSGCIKYAYTIDGKFNDNLTVTYFNNGTLLAQGRLTVLFSDFIVKCTESFNESIFEKELASFLSIGENEHKVIDVNLKKSIPHNYDKIEGKLELFIKTSIALINNIIELEDYTPHCMSALKALDGILKKRIIEETGEFNNYGEYFINTKNFFKLKNKTLFENKKTIDSLENAYSFFNKNRHTLFHVDNTIETSKILSYDESISIINNCIILISKICSNWE